MECDFDSRYCDKALDDFNITESKRRFTIYTTLKIDTVCKVEMVRCHFIIPVHIVYWFSFFAGVRSQLFAPGMRKNERSRRNRESIVKGYRKRGEIDTR